MQPAFLKFDSAEKLRQLSGSFALPLMGAHRKILVGRGSSRAAVFDEAG